MSALTSLRIFSLMAILSVVDVVVLYRAAVVTMAKGPSMMILFGFEFLILLATVVSTAAKFIINVIDSRQQGTWERCAFTMLRRIAGSCLLTPCSNAGREPSSCTWK